jgi:hypothetical protein
MLKAEPETRSAHELTNALWQQSPYKAPRTRLHANLEQHRSAKGRNSYQPDSCGAGRKEYYSEEISAFLKFAALDAVEKDSKHIFRNEYYR